MRTLIAIAFVFLSTFANAQNNNLVAEGATPNIYIVHTVSAKESYYSISRQYNVAPASIASFNNSNLQGGLKVGQTLKIPLTEQNFEQQSSGGSTGGLLPVYHVVAKNETLFRIGNNFNKVPLESIQSWNGLSGNNITAGTPLIVGYLRTGSDQSANTSTAVVAPSTIVNSQASQTTEEKKFEPAVTQPVQTQQPVANTTTDLTTEQKAAVTENVQVTNSTSNNTSTKPAETSAPAVTTLVPPVDRPAPKKQSADLLAPATNVTSDEGFFYATFKAEAEDRREVNSNGEAATFKSTSGWQNKKYYALINGVQPGTILKVESGDKVIFAKVLGALPDMKENTNLLMRLSNAAASYLGKVDPKFNVKITYYQ